MYLMGPRLLLNICEACYNSSQAALKGGWDCSLTATIDHSIRFAGSHNLPEREEEESGGVAIELGQRNLGTS